jgi:AcrR family transcriptional regulator
MLAMSVVTLGRFAPQPPARSARDRLLHAALNRFADQPPVAVSLEDIRREAGVSVGALYHHFRDKTALVDTLYLELTQRVQQECLAELRAHPSAEDGVKAIVRLYLRWVSANRAGAALLLGHRPNEHALRGLNRPFFTEVLGWWQTHVHYGILRSLPLDLIIALWLGPAQEYTRHWLSGQVKRVPRSVADVLAEAAWGALKQTT